MGVGRSTIPGPCPGSLWPHPILNASFLRAPLSLFWVEFHSQWSTSFLCVPISVESPQLPCLYRSFNLDVLYTPALVYTFVSTTAISGRVELSLLWRLAYDNWAWTQILRAAFRAGAFEQVKPNQTVCHSCWMAPKSSKRLSGSRTQNRPVFPEDSKIQPTWVRAIRKSLP